MTENSRQMAENRRQMAEKKQNQYTKEINLRSEAISLFDVQCWMFDVRRSVILILGIYHLKHLTDDSVNIIIFYLAGADLFVTAAAVFQD